MDTDFQNIIVLSILSLCAGYVFASLDDVVTPREINIQVNHQNKENVFFDIGYSNDLEVKQVGRICIQLQDEIVPITCKNFRELCRKNAYANIPFHRIINNFMIQGGDIANKDGTGCTSIYNGPFEDENFILKHDSEGIMSMANSGPHSNGSQFFITLAPTPHLDNKHVAFGKVTRGIEIIRNMGKELTDPADKPIRDIFIMRSGIDL